jgi:hypothetical protein
VADDRQPGRRWPPRRDPAGGRPAWRALLLAVAASGLLALVAMGSLRGPLGSGRGRPSYPADLINTMVLLLLVAAAGAGLLALLVLLPDQRLREPRARRRSSLLAPLLPLAVVALVWLFAGPLRLGGGEQEAAPASTLPVPPAPPPTGAMPRPGLLPLLVTGLLVVAVAAVVGAQLLAERRRRGPPRPRTAHLVELLGDTLDDLEGEADPRRAVIAAWARMEAGLAGAGLPRRPAEAPFEYVARVLAAARVRRQSVHRLTDLFERAKFSRHPIDRATRDEALAALRAVRRELADAADDAAQAGR